MLQGFIEVGVFKLQTRRKVPDLANLFLRILQLFRCTWNVLFEIWNKKDLQIIHPLSLSQIVLESGLHKFPGVCFPAELAANNEAEDNSGCTNGGLEVTFNINCFK